MPKPNGQAGTQQPIPFSLSLQAGVVKQTPAADVPVDANQVVVLMDATWLTDTTALISWGVERSSDGGQSWVVDSSGSRPGGNLPDKEGNLHPNIDITVDLVPLRGQKIRAFVVYTLGNTGQPASATATGTLTLS